MASTPIDPGARIPSSEELIGIVGRWKAHDRVVIDDARKRARGDLTLDQVWLGSRCRIGFYLPKLMR
jgi:hypothetical protein